MPYVYLPFKSHKPSVIFLMEKQINPGTIMKKGGLETLSR